MTVLSAIVATAGLLLDSAAVVVGSMVIAPLIGPALAASVGTVLNENHLFWKGITYQAVGVVPRSSARRRSLGSPERWRSSRRGSTSWRSTKSASGPPRSSLFIAFGAGIAGVLSLATGISSALVGVMIAAALIPPAAAGIAVAGNSRRRDRVAHPRLRQPPGDQRHRAVHAVDHGVSAARLTETRTARWKVRRNVVAFTIAILLSTFLIGVTWASYERATLESEIEAETESVLEEPAYQNVSVVEVELFLEEVPFEPATVLKEGPASSGPIRSSLPSNSRSERRIRNSPGR